MIHSNFMCGWCLGKIYHTANQKKSTVFQIKNFKLTKMKRGFSSGGGRSSICFGSSSTQKVLVSSNKFANGSNQNCNNILTDRSSTKIHAPPGGKSNISFGSSSTAPVKSSYKKQTVTTKKQAENIQTFTKKGTSSNKFANGSNQNCGNVITDRSSTRIHAPPGGRSQITFG